MKGSIWADMSWPTRLVLVGWVIMTYGLPIYVLWGK